MKNLRVTERNGNYVIIIQYKKIKYTMNNLIEKRGMTMKRKRWLSALIAVIMVMMLPCSVMAAQETKPYLSLGADLNDTEKSAVLELLGVKESELGNYTVINVTNADEHKYLDAYLDKKIIGSRALSSVKVEQTAEGNGIRVTTKNISYCTTEMYQNALATAGIKNADIIVAGPFSISGTAGLVGAIKAYETMTGQKVDSDNVDTATNELVVTSNLGETLEDPEKTAELIAFIKNEVASQNLTDDQISELINQASEEFGVTLSEENKQSILELMKKIDDLDLDVNQLKDQISNLYDKLDSMGIHIDLDSEEVQGFFSKIVEFIKDFLNRLG